MNSMVNGLEMGKVENARKLIQPQNPHFYGILAQVHNTL